MAKSFPHVNFYGLTAPTLHRRAGRTRSGESGELVYKTEKLAFDDFICLLACCLSERALLVSRDTFKVSLKMFLEFKKFYLLLSFNIFQINLFIENLRTFSRPTQQFHAPHTCTLSRPHFAPKMRRQN